MQNTKERSYLAAIISLYILEFGYATSQTMIGPAVPLLREKYSISLSANGLLSVLQGIGGIVVLLIGIVMFSRYKKALIVKIAFGIYTVAMLLLGFANTYALLLAMFFLLGVGTRSFDALVNASVTEITQERRNKYLNLLHAFFGAGSLVGPLLMNALIKKTANPSTTFLVIGIVCAAFLIINIFIQKPEKPYKVESTALSFKDTLKLLFDRRIIFSGFLGMLHIGLAMALSTWMPSYILSKGMSSTTSSLAVSLFWLGIIIGRLFYAKISSKYNEAQIIFVSNLIGGAAVLAASLTDNPILVIIGYIIAGFTMSEVVPLAVSIAFARFPIKNGVSTTVMNFYTTVGSMLMPFLIGLIADYVSFSTAMVVMSIIPLLASFVGFILKKEMKKDAVNS